MHSITVDNIPNEVNIADFLKEPEVHSKGLANLCRAAGLTFQKLLELSTATENAFREPYEDHHKAAISGAINEFWSQQSYTVHFRVDREKLSISIEDKTYGKRIPPSDRSDGFRWYLSFYSTLINEVSSTDTTFLLLDNPGLELHPDGQRDIKRSIEEKHSAAMQVLYVTHSPAMIDSYNLSQVRRVDLLENLEGTKVRKLQPKGGDDFDLLEPVRSAVGASLITSLMTNQYNILGEGAADRPILEAALTLCEGGIASKVVVNGSVSESLSMFPSFLERAKLAYVVYTDADSGGRDIVGKLREAGIPQEKIKSLDALAGQIYPPGTDFELEDLISDELYARAVLETYPDKPVDVPKDGNAKRCHRYEQAFKATHKIGFSKKRVAEKINLIVRKEGFDETSKQRVKPAIDGLVACLQEQTALG